jgi:diguanylate cyclase (GGDEF)-like protein
MLALPALMTTVALGLLVADHYLHLNAVAVWLACASIATAVVRFGFVFRQNLQLLGVSEIEAATDPLTGLGNRRALLRDLDRVVAAAAEDDPAVLAIFDLDGFKTYNDTFGHLAGDAVLQQSATRIASICRSTDVVARYGGEEFVVLLPDTDEQQAWRLAERILIGIRESPAVDAAAEIPVTASVGVATHRDGDMRLLMETADRALYQAKTEGRDRIAVLSSARV